MKINRKAELNIIVIVLVLGVLSSLLGFTVVQKFTDSTGKFLDGGQMCLSTLKLEQSNYYSANMMGVDAGVKMFSNRCYTIISDIEINKNHVKNSKSEEDKKNALLNEIAKRMAYVWWFTGEGSIDSLWSPTGISYKILGYGSDGNNNFKNKGCIRYLKFRLLDSNYLPKEMPTSEDLDKFMRNTPYKTVEKNGQKVLISYFDYINFMFPENSAGYFIQKMRFVKDSVYTVNLAQAGFFNEQVDVQKYANVIKDNIDYDNEKLTMILLTKENVLATSCKEVKAGSTKALYVDNNYCSKYLTEDKCHSEENKGLCFWNEDGLSSNSCMSCVKISVCSDYNDAGDVCTKDWCKVGGILGCENDWASCKPKGD